MKNPFDRATEISITHPKKVLAIGFVSTLMLASMAMFLEFDNSEDAFFPDNETVRLLNEVEGEYQASIDFVRIIGRMESGALSEEATWEHLAELESFLIEDENLSKYSYPIFGGQSNNGPASVAISWQKYQSPEHNSIWIQDLSELIDGASDSSNSSYNSSIGGLESAIGNISKVRPVTGEELDSWEFGQPASWLEDMTAGENIREELEEIMVDLQGMTSEDPDEELRLSTLRERITAALIPLIGYQSVDLSSSLLASVAGDSDDLLSSDGPVLISMAISTDSGDHDESSLGEIQIKVTEWADTIQSRVADTGDQDSTVFSFSQLAQGQNSNLGRELAILNSASLLILGSILYYTFRSLRDTVYVLGLTVFGILATYGTSGLLTKVGVDMTFNQAMNSIPVLLLAIGVDYGLHVVKRIREEYMEESGGLEGGRISDLSQEARHRAIRSGTTLTSIALLIAIFTDMVGFLSFRLSSQQFLVVFGTVIAIGLFYIYLFSITALPALIKLIPPKDMVVSKSVKVERNRLIDWIGELSEKPIATMFVAVVATTPMLLGVSQLEVGFDTRDNFDDSVPIVSDFLQVSDDFQNSPSPIYVVFEGDVVSKEGRESMESVIEILESEGRITVVVSDLWTTLEGSRGSDQNLSGIMERTDGDEVGSWLALKDWLLNTPEGRGLSSGLLSGSGNQTLISFQASTLDWSSTNTFQDELSSQLDDSTSETPFTAKVSGRSLILAQITSDVAEAAVLSTVVVAAVILLMLVIIHTYRTGDLALGLTRGLVTWIPLLAVVAWVYGIMGFTGFQLNSQTVTIGALTLGLGVDYAVHISTRIEEEVEKNPEGSPADWAIASVSTTGRAMAGAAVTTAGGFSVLNLSSLVPLQLFGQAFVVAISLALLSSILLLPSLYTNLMKWEQKRASLNL